MVVSFDGWYILVARLALGLTIIVIIFRQMLHRDSDSSLESASTNGKRMRKEMPAQKQLKEVIQ